MVFEGVRRFVVDLKFQCRNFIRKLLALERRVTACISDYCRRCTVSLKPKPDTVHPAPQALNPKLQAMAAFSPRPEWPDLWVQVCPALNYALP